MSYLQKLTAIFICTTLFIYFIIASTKTPPLADPIPSKPTADTVLSFTKETIIVTDTTGKADIRIDTGANDVNFVQIQISYNSQALSDITFEKGDFLQNADVLQNMVNKEKGLATYILSLPKKEKGMKGKGIVASLSFTTTLRDGDTTPLVFTNDTLVTNAHYASSLLKQTIDTKIIQKNAPQN